MELATVAITEDTASAVLEANARAPHGRTELYEEHDAIMDAVCEEVLKGHLIVDMRQCVLAGGTEIFEHWERFYADGEYHLEAGGVLMPRIALCRADATFCWGHAIEVDGGVRFQGVKSWWKTRPAKKELVELADVFDPAAEYRVHRRRRPHAQLARRSWLRALVPVVPAAMRPAEGVVGLQMLWEAEWQSNPPGDPALLKPLGGTLASVLAVWDLTELEQAVLSAVNT